MIKWLKTLINTYENREEGARVYVTEKLILMAKADFFTGPKVYLRCKKDANFHGMQEKLDQG